MKRAALLLALADGPPIEFAAVAAAGAVAAVTKPSGLEVGDLAIVFAVDIAAGDTLTTSGGSGWTRSVLATSAGTNSNSSIFWKVLNATDVANAWNFGAGPAQACLALRYRGHGATTVSVKATAANGVGGTSLAISGFTKAAGHYGVIAVGADAENSTFTPPAGFTSRYSAVPGSSYKVAACDMTLGYVDGSGVTFTNTNPGGGGQPEHGFLLEVTGP